MIVEAPIAWRTCDNADALASALADAVAVALQAAILDRGTAVLAVSGGTTPAPFFAALAKRELDWKKVTVTLVDERLVPVESPRSNEGLVRRHLLRDRAAAAGFVGLYRPGAPEDAAQAAEEAVQSLLPLDIAVLGMGTDGHTASFFPDAIGLEELLANRDRRAVLAVSAPSTPEARLTVSAQVLAGAGRLFMLITGADKRRILDAALAEEGAAAPVRRVLALAGKPVEIFWAP